MKYFFLTVIFLLQLIRGFAAKPSLAAGPMAGHTTPTSTSIWLLVKKVNIISVTLKERSSGEGIQTVQAASDTLFHYRSQSTVKFYFDNLLPGTEYTLAVYLDNIEIKNDFMVKTPFAKPENDFSFLLGSCAMIFPKFLWPFFPQNKGQIFVPMKKEKADFMVWLGDNVYYRKKEYRSLKGMFKRHLIERKRIRMAHFLRSMPQYAIWDDHDFGPNDSEGSFPLKENSCAIQKSFWANPPCEAKKGIFTHFRHYDAEIILTDNRYFRTQPEDSNATLLGKEQLQWLLDILKNSDAAFKFIVTGSQVLNEKNLNESYSHFPAERQMIFDFIRDNKISGVIFLTGDRHHSELLKMNYPGNYPFYDFTCSPLTGLARPTPKTNEATNPLRIENTLVAEHNFGKISVIGERGNRKCILETYDEKAKKIWEYIINENELKHN